MSSEDEIRSDRLILLSIALFIFVFVCVTVRAEADHWLCRVNDEWSLGTPVEFDGPSYSFVGLPDDLEIVDILYIQDDLNSAYVIYFSPSQQEHIIFPFWSLKSNADANGNHEGNHDFCTPRRYTTEGLR